MSDEGYTSVYTTYDKNNAVAVITALKSSGTKIIYRTTTETVSSDVLYEVCVLNDDINEAHSIILNLRLESQE